MEYPASRSTADIGNLNVVTGSGKTGECEGETVVIAIPNQHLAKKVTLLYPLGSITGFSCLQ
uniref:Uncharacterized protein n=1 Tax=Rhizophora mucronata TaxID=61149 RepID=A0A2P2MIU0_RHIMU